MRRDDKGKGNRKGDRTTRIPKSQAYKNQKGEQRIYDDQVHSCCGEMMTLPQDLSEGDGGGKETSRGIRVINISTLYNAGRTALGL